MNGSDTAANYEISSITDGNHSGSGNFYLGFSAGGIATPDAQALHGAVAVGGGWDAFMIAPAKAASWNPDANNSCPANNVCFYIDESVDRGSGTGTADCAVIARLSNNTEVVMTVLVSDGGCP
jgi:hypothetical protein